MALWRSTKLLVSLLPFTLCASSTIGGDGTCKSGGACENAAVKQADVNALFQSKSQVVTALEKSSVPPTVDPNKVADQVKVTLPDDSNKVADNIEESMRPRMRKLMEITKTVDDIETLAAAGTTPEVSEIIGRLITIIKDELLPKIIEDHDFAKTKVVQRITELTQTTESAVGEKTQADSADTSLDQCITEEAQFIKEYETCKEQEAALLSARDSDKFCRHEIFDFKGYTGVPALPVTWEVDFSRGVEGVHEQLDDYMKKVLTWLAATKKTAADDQGTWAKYTGLCADKTAEHDDKIEECGMKESHWRAKYEKCLHVASVQQKSLCQFGRAYQAKCASKISYDTLRDEITESGTPYSQPDRQQEYRQLARLTCVLDIFNTTTELNTGAVTKCTLLDGKAAKNFEIALGSIDLQKTTYELLTSEANFTCGESSIKFGDGIRWVLPRNNGEDGWIPKSTEYEKKEGYKYDIKSDSSSAPFDFCVEEGQHDTCGSSFDCSTGSGERKDPHTKCHMFGGCSSADCCADMFKAHPVPPLVDEGFEYINKLRCSTGPGALTKLGAGSAWDCVAFDTRTSVLASGNYPRGISFQCPCDNNVVTVGLQQAGYKGASPKASLPSTWDTSSTANFKQLYDAIIDNPHSCNSNNCAGTMFVNGIDAGFSCRQGELFRHSRNAETFEKLGDSHGGTMSIVVEGNDFKWYVDGKLEASELGIPSGVRKSEGIIQGPLWVVATIYNGASQSISSCEESHLSNLQFITEPGQIWAPAPTTPTDDQ